MIALLASLAPYAPRIALGLAVTCGAVVPGPCSFDPRRDFDCSLGEACDENFACAVDGFCKSADIACLEGEARCEVPGLERVGICVPEEDFATSKTHCGLCFNQCLGAGVCVDGVCEGAPAAGECLEERGHFDCAIDQVCDDGACVDDADSSEDRGDGDPGDPCERDDDCEGGICEDDLCTSPCDFGCPFGFECDDDAIAGGLCVPGGDVVCE